MKIFVAGLPYDMDDAELEEFFEKFGTVASVKVAMDRETGKSKGFGFVDMPNDEEAKEAIDILISTKMIYKNISGFYKPRDTIVIKDTSPSITWATYMSENILLAKEAIFNVPKCERDISAITIGLSGENYEIACQKIKELRRYLLSLSENDKHAKTIYQVNVQLFPLTKSSKDA